MKNEFLIPMILFGLSGVCLVTMGIHTLIKKEMTITSRNMKYLFLNSVSKLVIPGAYNSTSYQVKGWKKTFLALLLIVLGVCALIVTYQLYILRTSPIIVD